MGSTLTIGGWDRAHGAPGIAACGVPEREPGAASAKGAIGRRRSRTRSREVRAFGSSAPSSSSSSRLAFICAVSPSTVSGAATGSVIGVTHDEGAPGIPAGAAWARAPGGASAKGAIGRCAREESAWRSTIAVRSSSANAGGGSSTTGGGAISGHAIG